MTEGEAKALEMEPVVFPLDYDLNEVENKLSEEAAPSPVVAKPRFENFDVYMRFARMKKTIKKRSANIL